MNYGEAAVKVAFADSNLLYEKPQHNEVKDMISVLTFTLFKDIFSGTHRGKYMYYCAVSTEHVNEKGLEP